MKLLFAIWLIILLPVGAAAQTESNDSLRIDAGTPDTLRIDAVETEATFLPPAQISAGSIGPSFRNRPLNLPRFHLADRPYLPLWEGGKLGGTIVMQSMPGLMGLESGTISISQEHGPLTLTAYVESLKYAGYFGGLYNSQGYGGSLSYRVADNVAITVFGSYYTSPGRNISPAMAGYMKIPTFGGYVDYKANDSWGVKTGIRTYQPMVGSRETLPIVEPYIKINGRDYGIDFGGILYQLIRGARHSAPGPMGPPPPRGPR